MRFLFVLLILVSSVSFAKIQGPDGGPLKIFPAIKEISQHSTAIGIFPGDEEGYVRISNSGYQEGLWLDYSYGSISNENDGVVIIKFDNPKQPKMRMVLTVNVRELTRRGSEWIQEATLQIQNPISGALSTRTIEISLDAYDYRNL